MVDFVKNRVVGDRCGGKADLSLQEVSYNSSLPRLDCRVKAMM